jgi:hypothetical protein
MGLRRELFAEELPHFLLLLDLYGSARACPNSTNYKPTTYE